MIKRTLSFLQSIMVEVLGLGVLLVLYGASLYNHLPALGAELTLFEAAKDFHFGHLPLEMGVPVSALLTAIVSLLGQVTHDTLFVGRVATLVCGLVAVLMIYALGARVFHTMVGAIAAGVALACWGIFVNSTLANGVMLQVGLVSLIFLLFYHWFDSAFRSRTLARSLVVHFILVGLALTLTLAVGGISFVVFAALVMLSTLVMTNRLDLVQEIRLPWLAIPLGGSFLVWLVALLLGAGVWPGLVTVFACQPSLAILGQLFLYLMPIAPLLVPALIEKDIISRALLSHSKALTFLVSWIGWALILGLLFGNHNEAFTVLALIPLLLWLGHYLYEVFRNPVIPKPLQVVVDVMIFAGLVTSIGLTLLTFQLVPADLKWPFFIFCCLLPVLSVILALLREFTTSRFLVLSMIPYGLILCVLAQNTLLPLARYTPSWRLAPTIEKMTQYTPQTQVLEWHNPSSPQDSITRLNLPPYVVYKTVEQLPQLEAAIVARHSDLLVLIPEHVYYQLSWRLRESLYPVDQSWQWKRPFTTGVLLQSLQNERLDLSTLTEPVYLLRAPAGLE